MKMIKTGFEAVSGADPDPGGAKSRGRIQQGRFGETEL